MRKSSDSGLEYLAFFFVDIVGLSNPALSTTTQTAKLNAFNDCVSQCDTLRSTPRDDMLFLGTGDGMLIGFKNSLEKPLNLALELHDKLHKYNQDQPQSAKIFIRIGLHIGNIFSVKDIFGIPTGWGPGTILARRVMDLGDENHILMTSEMADALFRLSEDYRKIIHPIHDYQIKHNQTMLVYSVHGENFGNPRRPIKGLNVEEKLAKLSQELSNKILFSQIEIHISLDDSNPNLLRCKKIYHFENVSNEPIFVVMLGINTSLEKSLFELNVQAFDENNKQLSISGINLDTPYRKEFSLKLNSPVFKNDKNKKYSVFYDEEHNHIHEHSFLSNVQNLLVTFDFPSNSKPNPQLVLISDKGDSTGLNPDSQDTRGIRTKISWGRINNITAGSLIRLIW